MLTLPWTWREEGGCVRAHGTNKYGNGVNTRYSNKADPVAKATLPVDDDEEFFSPERHKKELREYAPGDNLYHNCNQGVLGHVVSCHVMLCFPKPPCSLQSPEGGTAGTPSAFVGGGKGNDKTDILHCFACDKTYFILKCNDPNVYDCKPPPPPPPPVVEAESAMQRRRLQDRLQRELEASSAEEVRI